VCLRSLAPATGCHAGTENTLTRRRIPQCGLVHDWLRNPATLDPEDCRAFAALRQSELKTARAWAL